MNTKILAGIVISILVLNMILFALGKVSVKIFWMIIGVGALAAYYVVPKLKAVSN